MPDSAAPRASDRATLLKSPIQATVRPARLAEGLAHREEVGQGLARVGLVGEEVDHRDARRARPWPRDRRGRTPGRRAGRGSRRGRWRCRPASPGRRRRSRRVAPRSGGRRAGRRPSRTSGGSAGSASRTAARRPCRRAACRGRPPRLGRARRRAPRPRGRRSRGSASRRGRSARRATASSISSSVTVRGGARRSAVGVTALTTSPASRAAAAIALASRPGCSSAASSSPRPRTAATSGRSSNAAVSRSPGLGGEGWGRRGGSSRPARRARPRPPAAGRRRWWRGRRARRPRPPPARAQQAPMGTPLPSAFAIVTTSGCTPACWKPNQRPVRPSPVCTSSRIRRIPRSSQSARTPRRYSTDAGLHAALALHRLEQHGADASGRGRARGRRGRRRRRAGTLRAAAGTPRAWSAGPVACSVARVRPWKLPKRRHHDVPAPPAELAGELDGALVGLGAAVAEEHLPAGRLAVADEHVEGGGNVLARFGAEEVRHVQQRAGLLGQASATAGLAWPSPTTARPGQEVEVAMPLGVPELGPGAPDEGDRRPARTSA